MPEAMGEVAGRHQGLLERQSAVQQRVAVALQPVAAQHVPQGAGHEADPAVAMVDQMFRRPPGGGDVVDLHRRQVAVGQIFARHHHRRRTAAGAGRRRQPGRQTAVQQDHAVGAPGCQQGAVGGLLPGVVLRIRQQHGIAVPARDLLDAADDLVEEGVGDVGQQHGDQPRLLLAQVAGQQVRGVAAGGDRLGDPPARLLRHRIGLLQRPRHGGRRHPGQTRHVAQRHRSRAFHRRPSRHAPPSLSPRDGGETAADCQSAMTGALQSIAAAGMLDPQQRRGGDPCSRPARSLPRPPQRGARCSRPPSPP
jgi:hypothetical protein